MTPAQTQTLHAALRPGESVILAAPCGEAPQAAPVAAPKSSFWARLFGKKAAAAAPAPRIAAGDSFFAITSKRVLVFDGAPEPREWFLMLGMIQRFDLNPDGSGSIILDYELTQAGERRLLGLFNIADAENVHNRLRSAIDEAYNASPWSV